MKSDRVVPVVIFLKDGKVPRRRLCLGIDGRSYLRFHYIARVLPRLPARRYFESDNIVARLNLVTMRHARKDRPVVYGQALKGLLALEANADKQRKYLDFIDMYLPLEDNEREVFERTYRQENERMGGIVSRAIEQGIQQGIQQGVQQGMEQGMQEGLLAGRREGELSGRLDTLSRQVRRRFGPLDASVEARLKAATPAEVDQWIDNILDARSLDEVFRVQ